MRPVLLLFGIVALVIGLWFGIAETYSPEGAFGRNYCGSPISPYYVRGDEAGCSSTMRRLQVYTWLIIGAGVAALTYRILRLNTKKPRIPQL